MDTRNILTIGIDYHIVHGGVAAVENVYSTFYKPFNHVATVVDYGALQKLTTFIKAYALFWKWMLFHREIKIVHVHGASDASFWRKRILSILLKCLEKSCFPLSWSRISKIYSTTQKSCSENHY